MNCDYALRHKTALLNPYGSVVKSFDCPPDSILVGIKNVSSIPNTLMKKLEPYGFALHTIDKKSQLAGRAVDTQLINPLTGHYMSGSSSGTALNVFAGINDLGIGNDGGGSVLAPAMCVNILGFISPLIEKDRVQIKKANTDGQVTGNSLGFFSRNRDIMLKAIEISMHIQPSPDPVSLLMDQAYEGFKGEIYSFPNCMEPREVLTEKMKELAKTCDVMMVSEGPVDLEGFGDSLFGHFDERTKKIQEASKKGFVRICNPAGLSAMVIPQKGLGMATLLMCESTEEKIAKMLSVFKKTKEVHDPLIERYFLDLNNYFNDGYQV
jgi:hypothetical protein